MKYRHGRPEYREYDSCYYEIGADVESGVPEEFKKRKLDGEPWEEPVAEHR